MSPDLCDELLERVERSIFLAPLGGPQLLQVVEQPSPEVVDYIYMIRAGRINMFWQPATLQWCVPPLAPVIRQS
jgi:hypothetical protein